LNWIECNLNELICFHLQQLSNETKRKSTQSESKSKTNFLKQDEINQKQIERNKKQSFESI